jgi:chitin synthase
MKFLSEIHLDRPMNPIELELGFHFNEKIGIDPRNYEFLMWIDGDTEIGEDSLSRLVSAMENDSTISGICGETELRNPSDSWVTMIQVEFG